MASTSADPSHWPALPPELLLSIAARLLIPDLFRLRCVCHPWSSALSHFRPASPHFPWLSLLRPSHPSLPSLLSPQESRSYSPIPLPSSTRFLGALAGHLIALDPSSLFLLNPLTGSRSRLPDPSNLPGHDHIRKVVLSSFPSPGHEFAAMACFRGAFRDCLAFALEGDPVWTLINVEKIPSMDDGVADIVYHDHPVLRGMFFAISNQGTIHGYCLHREGPSVVVFVFKPTLLADAPFRRFLVSAADGDLFQVKIGKDLARAGGAACKIKRFDPEVAQSCWVSCEGLGCRSLFLDSKSSMLLEAEGYPGMTGNCIYAAIEESEDGGVCEVGVLDVGEGSVEPCFPPKLRMEYLTAMPPMWFMPSLL